MESNQEHPVQTNAYPDRAGSVFQVRDLSIIYCMDTRSAQPA
jgi:hypothetical protein